ncbi:DUF6973 domain-containing protein [Aestuariivivens marinum]|uniref:DUF6973 domain-containing protein n=1 Tax=Aestuariivivens marinum TaxID=2913555 RepID=UPI001F58E922|nr:hypothetical protein [Aestuariivivens marinum]
MEHISFDELQNRIGSTKAFSKSESYIKTGKSQTSTKATDDDRYELLTDEVLMIDLEESTHFTLKLIDNQSELISEFYNFIFTLDKATNHVSSQIVRYIPNKDWLNDPSQPYNGYIKMLDSEIFTLDAISKTSSVSKSTVDTYLCIDNVFYYWRCNADNPHSPEDYVPGGACRVGGNTLYINFTWTFCTTDSDLEGVEDSGFHTIYDPYNTGDTSGGGGGTATVPELPQETIDKLEALEKMVQTLRLNDDEVDFLYRNYRLFGDIDRFLRQDKIDNGGEENTIEAIRFANDVIDAIKSNDFTALFLLDVFTQDPYDVWMNQLNAQEKDIIKNHPFKAYRIFKNRTIAETETVVRFGVNGLNDKSDAFRHAFFQAINSHYVGVSVSGDLADAHESEVPTRWILEKEMDLFNNEYGLVIGSENRSASNQTISNLIYQAVTNGDLLYLSPINYSDPNFLDNPNTTELGDGTHGISPSTLKIPTNQ